MQEGKLHCTFKHLPYFLRLKGTQAGEFCWLWFKFFKFLYMFKFKRWRRGESVLCSLATVTSCIDPSIRIVTKTPKVGPLLIFSISLVQPKGTQGPFIYSVSWSMACLIFLNQFCMRLSRVLVPYMMVARFAKMANCLQRPSQAWCLRTTCLHMWCADPNSWTYNLVEFSDLRFPYTISTLQNSFKPLLLKGGRGE